MEVRVPENFTTAMVMVVGGVVTQVLTGVITWLQSRKNHVKLKSIEATQIETKHDLNSRLTEMLAAVTAQAHAAGVLEGIEMQKRIGDGVTKDKSP